MNKAPSFQFYPSDYLADGNVALMTLEHEGAYVRLLCYCWNEGSIPDDVGALARYCRTTPEKMAELWPVLKNCFVLKKNDMAKLIHPRLEKERKKQKEHSKKRSEAGAKGAKKRWQSDPAIDSKCHGNAIDLPIAKNSSSSSTSSPSSKKIISSPKITFSEADAATAEFMVEKIRALDPSFQPKNKDSWANEIRLMVEQDKRTHDDIRALFEKVGQDAFWRKNILSPAKLREKWSQLLIAFNTSAASTAQGLSRIEAIRQAYKQGQSLRAVYASSIFRPSELTPVDVALKSVDIDQAASLMVNETKDATPINQWEVVKV